MSQSLLQHLSQSVSIERKLMLLVWNRETKTAAVTQNLAPELKSDTVARRKKTHACPVGHVTENFMSVPASLSK